MKVVILAGGYGTRISEESYEKPKPLVEICQKPILWHVMRIFHQYGFKEFIICTGYRGEMINDYFGSYFLNHSDISLDFKLGGEIAIHKQPAEDWKVTIVNTGRDTMTGGRIKRIEPYVHGEPFFLTYGDGVSNVNISKLLEFHRRTNNFVTVTAVKPQGRYGILKVNTEGQISRFAEKNLQDVDWINGGFMVAEPQLFSYLKGDGTVLEREPFEMLAKENKMGAYCHTGFWHCVDTVRDKKSLEEYIQTHSVPWLETDTQFHHKG